jgi:hypothetical protein
MGDQALRDAAVAITALATALGTAPEQTLITVEPFLGDGTQDPLSWLQEFQRACKANRWNDARRLELAPVYMKGIALDWYRSLNPLPNAYNNDAGQARSFKHLFKARFSTAKQKAIWQKQLFDIKQGTDSVDAYVSRFRSLRRKVDPADAFPVAFVVQLFIQGLQPEYAVNVQASEPATLDDAITAARRWETGRLMANATTTETDQAIKQLTDQIAQLSINLAQKTTPITVNYTDTPNQAPPI